MDNRHRRGRHRRLNRRRRILFSALHRLGLSGLVVMAIVLVVAAPASPQGFEVLGTRALGMGGAFVAVADDATASYWNPAGLATGAFFSLLVDHTRGQTRVDPASVHSPGADKSATIVGMSTNSLAFSYYRLRINQIERPFLPDPSPDPARNNQLGEATLRSVTTHNVALTGVQLLSEGFSVGSTIRYVYGSYGVDSGDPALPTDAWLDHAAGLEQKGQHKADLDVGIKVGGQTVQAGFVARNLLQPTLTGLDGSSIRIDRQFRAGLAFRPAGRFIVAADVDVNRLETVGGDRQNVAVGGRALVWRMARHSWRGSRQPRGTRCRSKGRRRSFRGLVWLCRRACISTDS